MIFYKESPTNINLKLYNTRVSNPDVVQQGPINWSIATLCCIFLFTAATPLSVGIFDVIGVHNELHLGTDFIQLFLLLFLRSDMRPSPCLLYVIHDMIVRANLA